MRRYSKIVIIVIAVSILAAWGVYAYDLPKWFPFNKQNALSEWHEKVFKDRVLYNVEEKSSGGYLSANSNQACSGLVYKIKFDPRKDPLISWQWKVSKFPDKTSNIAPSGGWLEKDDYAARVYVIFSGWNFMNIQSIEYIWDESLPEGTIITSPYFKGLKLIVVESGKKNIERWVYEKRNIYDDYKKAFGRPPRRRVSAIALMTDSDNTLSTAEAFYRNIKVGYRDE